MATTTDLIQQLYVAYYNRPADVRGLEFWVDAYDSGRASLDTISQAFNNAPEYTSLFAGKGNESIVNIVYQNLFGRTPDTEGLNFWSKALENKQVTVADLVKAVAAGALNTDGSLNSDGLIFANKVAAAEAFTTEIATAGNEAERIAYADGSDATKAAAKAYISSVTTDASLATAIAGVHNTAQTIVPGPVVTTTILTGGIDTVVGGAGNDTIQAPAATSTTDTLSSLDSIDGGAGTDTINVVLSTGAMASAGVTVKNVEIANVTSAVPVTAADTSLWTGLQTLNVVSGGDISGVVAAATTDINVANGVGNVSVDGGKVVTITNNAAGIVSVGGALGAGTGAAGNVVVTNAAAGAVNVKGAAVETVVAKSGAIVFTNGTAINATASTAIAASVVAAHTSAASAASSAYTAATTGNGGNGTDASGQALTDLQTAGTAFTTLAAALAVAGSVTNYSADQTATNSIGAATTAAVAAGAITVAQKVSIDAAFITGLATNAAAGRAAALALVTPLQTANTSAIAAAVTADAAHDASLLAAKTAALAITTADTNALNFAKQDTVKAITNTSLASATITGNAGTATTQVGSAGGMQNYVVDGSTLHNTLTSVTLNNTGNSELNGTALVAVSATGMSGNVTVVNSTAAHTETFTLSGVTAGTYTDDNATTVNVVSNGTATNVLTGLHGTLATTVNVSGAAGASLGTVSVAAAAVIDAHTATGAVSVTTAAATQSYKGGSGADTVTVSNGGVAQSAVIDGGAGTADKIVLNDATGVDFGTAAAAAKFTNFEILQLGSGVSVADIAVFTGSTFTSAVLAGGAQTLGGLNATQATHLTIKASGTDVIGVTGASTVGQLDTVSLTISDGASSTSTVVLTTPSLVGVETLNINAVDNVTISALTLATALTNVNVTGAGQAIINSGAVALNVNTVVDATANGNDNTLDFHLATGNGVSLKAGAGDNILLGTDIAAKGNSITAGDGANTVTGGQADDTITLGNGDNTVHGAAGSNTITVGNGNNHIDSVGSAGVNTIVAGNGYNVIAGGSGADKITVGTGGNLVTGGAGADIIKFGAHVAGVTDGLVFAGAGGVAVGADAATAIVANGTVGANTDIVTGFHAGDQIITGLSTNPITISNLLAGTFGAAATTADLAFVVRGTYTASTGDFTASASGADTYVLINDHTGGAGHSDAVVLVGYAGAATTTIVGGVLTLG